MELVIKKQKHKKEKFLDFNNLKKNTYYNRKKRKTFKTFIFFFIRGFFNLINLIARNIFSW